LRFVNVLGDEFGAEMTRALAVAAAARAPELPAIATLCAIDAARSSLALGLRGHVDAVFVAYQLESKTASCASSSCAATH